MSCLKFCIYTYPVNLKFTTVKLILFTILSMYQLSTNVTFVLLLLYIILLQSQNPDPHVTVRPSGSVTTGGICSHQSDCADELCCVHTGLTGKRRKRLFFDGLFDHHGVCQPYRALVRRYRLDSRSVTPRSRNRELSGHHLSYFCKR